MMMCYCMFINCDKRDTLVGDIDHGGGSTRGGARGIRESSGLSAQFSCDPKTALKNK